MAKAKTTKQLLIELIDLSSGTQTRPLDDETVKDYSDLIKDRVVLPPVDVVLDGGRYIPFDGYHRIAAHKSLGRKHIKANVRTGSLREAIWLSYSSNKTHGLKRQKGVKKDILTKIFQDKDWSQKPISEIAKHVGCGRQYASEIKNELSYGVVTRHHSERSDSVEVTRKGTTYKQRSQEREHRPAKELNGEMLDFAGNDIPYELREIWLGKVVIQEKINELDKIKNHVQHMVEDGNPSWGLLNTTAFHADYQNMRNRLKGAMLFAVCPYCNGSLLIDGKPCSACHNTGFVNEVTYKASPK